MGFEIIGLSQLIAKFENMIRDAPEENKRDIRESAGEVLKNAQGYTPVRTGALRDSGRLEDGDDESSVKIIFGSDSVDYAVPVHENLDAHHDNGQAKFLERACQESPEVVGGKLVYNIQQRWRKVRV